jgi:predicted Zn-dependent protease
MQRVLAIAAIVIVGAASGSVMARDDCVRECKGEAGCEVQVTTCLIRANRNREAIERLKPIAKSHPDNAVFARLLARTYLAEGNAFWALRTLHKVVERDPGDWRGKH